MLSVIHANQPAEDPEQLGTKNPIRARHDFIHAESHIITQNRDLLLPKLPAGDFGAVVRQTEMED